MKVSLGGHRPSSWFKLNLPYRTCLTDCLFLLLSYTWSLAYTVCSAVDTLTHCLVWLTIGGPIDPQTLSGLVDTRWRGSILDGAGLQVGSPTWAPHQNVQFGKGASGIQGHTGCLGSFIRFGRRSLSLLWLLLLRCSWWCYVVVVLLCLDVVDILRNILYLYPLVLTSLFSICKYFFPLLQLQLIISSPS